jgi:hypothetical protein
MTALISGLISDAKALLQQELLLAKHEIRDELDKTKKAVISLGTGIGIAVLGYGRLEMPGRNSRGISQANP